MRGATGGKAAGDPSASGAGELDPEGDPVALAGNSDRGEVAAPGESAAGPGDSGACSRSEVAGPDESGAGQSEARPGAVCPVRPDPEEDGVSCRKDPEADPPRYASMSPAGGHIKYCPFCLGFSPFELVSAAVISGKI